MSLHDACAAGDLHRFKALCPPDVNAVLVQDDDDDNGYSTTATTALHVASGHGHLKLVQYLILIGAAPDVVDNDDRTALHEACERGHLSVCKFLCSTDASLPWQPDSFGETPLHNAVAAGQVDVVRYLVKLQQEEEAPQDGDMLPRLVDLPERSGKTALHVAVKQADQGSVATTIEILACLCHRGGANVHARDGDGLTPLQLACRQPTVLLDTTIPRYLMQDCGAMPLKESADAKKNTTFDGTTKNNTNNNNNNSTHKYTHDDKYVQGTLFRIQELQRQDQQAAELKRAHAALQATRDELLDLKRHMAKQQKEQEAWQQERDEYLQELQQEWEEHATKVTARQVAQLKEELTAQHEQDQKASRKQWHDTQQDMSTWKQEMQTQMTAAQKRATEQQELLVLQAQQTQLLRDTIQKELAHMKQDWQTQRRDDQAQSSSALGATRNELDNLLSGLRALGSAARQESGSD